MKRKLRSGVVTSPCSISHTPLRVSPVSASDRGSSTRVYQKSVTSTPRSTPATSSAAAASTTGPSTSAADVAAGIAAEQRRCWADGPERGRADPVAGRRRCRRRSAVRRSWVSDTVVPPSTSRRRRRRRALGVVGRPGGRRVVDEVHRRVELGVADAHERASLGDRLGVEPVHAERLEDVGHRGRLQHDLVAVGRDLDRVDRRVRPWPRRGRRGRAPSMSASRPDAARADAVAAVDRRAIPAMPTSAHSPATDCPAELTNAPRPMVRAAVPGRLQAAGGVDESPSPAWRDPPARRRAVAASADGIAAGSARRGQPGPAGSSGAIARRGQVRSTRAGEAHSPTTVDRAADRAAVACSGCSRRRLSSATFWWITELAKRVSAEPVAVRPSPRPRPRRSAARTCSSTCAASSARRSSHPSIVDRGAWHLDIETHRAQTHR